MTLTIEAGKFYRTRDGEKMGPIADYDHSTWKWTDGGSVWAKDGSYWGRTLVSPHDLVSEWVDEPSPALTEDEKMAGAGWIKHDGKGMPVDGKVVVTPFYRDGLEGAPDPADTWPGWDWSKTANQNMHMTHYRIVSPNTDRAQVEALGQVADAPDAMTLRDQFAMSALPAVVAVFDKYSPDVATHENFATEAYRIADAMLAERAKK